MFCISKSVSQKDQPVPDITLQGVGGGERGERMGVGESSNFK